MITASVVLYNTCPDLIDGLLSSFEPGEDRKLFLIDNSPEKEDRYNDLANVTYYFVGKNIGYGAAHNIGLKKAIELNSKYHIVLNPDVHFEPSVIDALATYADAHEDVVYMLPKVLYPDGEMQYLCKLLPTPSDLIFRRFLPQVGAIKRKNDRYTLKTSGYNKIMNPPCLSGCFMFLRTKTIQEENLFFDDRYFMYCEDFDLIRRLHRVGKTLYYPDETIVHDHARESYRNWKMLRVHIRSACRYFNKFGWFRDRERMEMNRKILEEIEH